MDDPSDFQIRLEALKLAASSESDPDQIIIDAEKFRLFLNGEEQESEDDEPARG